MERKALFNAIVCTIVIFIIGFSITALVVNYPDSLGFIVLFLLFCVGVTIFYELFSN